MTFSEKKDLLSEELWSYRSIKSSEEMLEWIYKKKRLKINVNINQILKTLIGTTWLLTPIEVVVVQGLNSTIKKSIGECSF